MCLVPSKVLSDLFFPLLYHSSILSCVLKMVTISFPFYKISLLDTGSGCPWYRTFCHVRAWLDFSRLISKRHKPGDGGLWALRREKKGGRGIKRKLFVSKKKKKGIWKWPVLSEQQHHRQGAFWERLKDFPQSCVQVLHHPPQRRILHEKNKTNVLEPGLTI